MEDSSIHKNSGGPSRPRSKKGPWLWIILGLVLLGTPVISCGGCIYFFYTLGTAPLNAAVESLNKDVDITKRLGSPIVTQGGFSMNNYNNQNNNGSAELEFNAAGPNGSANVSGKMKLIAGTWSPDGLVVTFEDGTTQTLN